MEGCPDDGVHVEARAAEWFLEGLEPMARCTRVCHVRFDRLVCGILHEIAENTSDLQAVLHHAGYGTLTLIRIMLMMSKRKSSACHGREMRRRDACAFSRITIFRSGVKAICWQLRALRRTISPLQEHLITHAINSDAHHCLAEMLQELGQPRRHYHRWADAA